MAHAIVLTPNDREQYFSELRETFKAEIKQWKGYVVEQPMTVKEAAAYLRISKSTFWERINKGIIPSNLIHRSAGSVYFFASELHQYIKNN